MSFRVAVLVSGTGSNLQALLDQVHGDDGIEIVCVGSNKPEAMALERAARAGVETAAFPAGDYADRETRDDAMGDWLASHGTELVVLAGFMELLSPGFIDRFRDRVINVHPSLLPSFPGLHPIEEALNYGVQLMGVTVHFVDEGVDSGAIILQEAFQLPYHRDIETVETRVHEIEHRLLPRAVRLIAAGELEVEGRQVRIRNGEG